MAFVWDDEKEADNIQTHHIHFATAAYVFDDPLRLIRHDDDSSEGEERYQTIGLAGQVLFVVYTEKDADDIRIISARIAEPKERRLYYGDGTTYPHGWERA